jgi:hypothetical protein
MEDLVEKLVFRHPPSFRLVERYDETLGFRRPILQRHLMSLAVFESLVCPGAALMRAAWLFR